MGTAQLLWKLLAYGLRARETALALVLCMQDEASTEAYFQQWMDANWAAYEIGSPEYAARTVIFKSNLEKNLQANSAATTYYAAVNAFADLAWDEFAARELVERKRKRLLEAPPDVIDWEKDGKVSAVGDQQNVSRMDSESRSSCAMISHSSHVLNGDGTARCSASTPLGWGRIHRSGKV